MRHGVGHLTARFEEGEDAEIRKNEISLLGRQRPVEKVELVQIRRLSDEQEAHHHEQDFTAQNSQPGFDLRAFVDAHFTLPADRSVTPPGNPSLRDHIKLLLDQSSTICSGSKSGTATTSTF